MLPETASSIGDRPAARTAYRGMNDETSALHDQVRQMVRRVFMIERETFQFDESAGEQILRHQLIVDPSSRLTGVFEGRLSIDSEAAYDQLDELFKSINHTPVFRQDGAKQYIYAVTGRSNPPPRSATLNIILFVVTVISVLMVGAELEIYHLASSNEAALALFDNFMLEIWRGFPYAASILLILGAHEMGHYFAAKRHKLAVTLPYFIPAPPGIVPTFIGTFGAFIQLRAPIKNRKVLLDVGAAGPLIGLAFAVPILLIGLATSPIVAFEPGELYSLEGSSLLYALSKFIIFGRVLPSGVDDVFLNQLAQAGWTGLLITAINLIPIGQLDGGHLLYSLLGGWARRLYYPMMLIILILGMINITWMFWFILLLLFGRLYAVPLDDITPLDPRRKFIAILGLFVFVVAFVPEPFRVFEAPTPGAVESVWLFPLMLGLVGLWTSRRLRR